MILQISMAHLGPCKTYLVELYSHDISFKYIYLTIYRQGPKQLLVHK